MLTLLSVAAILYAAVSADDTKPAEKMSLSTAIAAIRASPHVPTAGQAYARAVSISRDDPAVHRTYIERLLTLGQPSLAHLPAVKLTELSRRDPLGWAAIGYVQAVRRNHGQALIATLKAVEYGQADKSLMHNLGNLARWYQHTNPKPRLPDSQKRFLDGHLSDWRSNVDFSNAYDTCDTAYGPILTTVEKFETQLQRRQQELKELTDRLTQCDKTHRQNSKEIARLEEDIQEAEKEKAAAECTTGTCSQSQLIAAARAKWTIDDCQEKIDNARKENADLKREATVIRKKLPRVRKDVAATQRLTIIARTTMPTSVTWMPPAVDGVITPVAGPQAARHRAAAAAGVPKPSPERQLKMAGMLLGNGKKREALLILQAVVREHPETPHARKAQAVIDKHQLDYRLKGAP